MVCYRYTKQDHITIKTQRVIPSLEENTGDVPNRNIEMAWAAKRPANEPLTDLFTGLLTARFYLCLLLGR